MSRRADCVAKLFSRPKSATLIGGEHATLMQNVVQVDSIISLSQCSEEFCNTIGHHQT
jgi:hypothetical protein